MIRGEQGEGRKDRYVSRNLNKLRRCLQFLQEPEIRIGALLDDG